MDRLRYALLTLASVGVVGCTVGYGAGSAAAYDERSYQGRLEAQPEIDAEGVRVLMFTKTAGFRHDSISTSKEVMQALADTFGFRLTLTEDASYFSAETLSDVDIVMFASTTGEVLDAAQQEALQGFIEAGGGFMGVHAASDTLYTWPWYGDLVGAYFSGHPPGTQLATVDNEDPAHPLTRHLRPSFQISDEWYFFDRNPRDDVQVLLSLDKSSNVILALYPGADPEGDYPITWCHAFGGGRSWYTALGHRSSVWRDVRFQELLLHGILWSAGRAPDVACEAE